jgi:hypothetical protein
MKCSCSFFRVRYDGLIFLRTPFGDLCKIDPFASAALSFLETFEPIRAPFPRALIAVAVSAVIQA